MGVRRSKDTGAYDLGELDDQALFLYLDGQDSSTIQDQRRNCSISLSPNIYCFYCLNQIIYGFVFLLPFSPFSFSVKKILSGQAASQSQEKHGHVFKSATATTFFDQILAQKQIKSLYAQTKQRKLKLST